ncbi:DUF2795 domain-containing protein [Streptomyces sp. NPDC005706]|uniref:DUF2795 domain-containing protein n=1 Tax=Streptomyces sp. NPDC005706 TaxID=3157169 RepID=UPI0033DA741D
MLDAPQDVDFPAGKEELVQAAENACRRGASRHSLGIPSDEYGSRDEVARSVRLDPASELDLSAAQRVEQDRRGGRPGGRSPHLA